MKIQRYDIQVKGTDMGYDLLEGVSFCLSKDVEKLEQLNAEMLKDVKMLHNCFIKMVSERKHPNHYQEFMFFYKKIIEAEAMK